MTFTRCGRDNPFPRNRITRYSRRSLLTTFAQVSGLHASHTLVTPDALHASGLVYMYTSSCDAQQLGSKVGRPGLIIRDSTLNYRIVSIARVQAERKCDEPF